MVATGADEDAGLGHTRVHERVPRKVVHRAALLGLQRGCVVLDQWLCAGIWHVEEPQHVVFAVGEQAEPIGGDCHALGEVVEQVVRELPLRCELQHRLMRICVFKVLHRSLRRQLCGLCIVSRSCPFGRWMELLIRHDPQYLVIRTGVYCLGQSAGYSRRITTIRDYATQKSSDLLEGEYKEGIHVFMWLDS